MKNRSRNIIFDIIAIMIMAGFAVAINRSIQISGLYMDDLLMWSYYSTDSLKDFCLPASGSHFRPFFWLLSYLEYMFLGNNIHLCVYINIAVIIAAAVLVYYFVLYLSQGRAVSLLAGLAVIASRFSYYAVGQLIGTLESVAMLLTIGEAFFLIDYMRSRRSFEYYIALLLFTLSVFTHERYMVFIVMFIYVLIFTKTGGKPGRSRDNGSSGSRNAGSSRSRAAGSCKGGSGSGSVSGSGSGGGSPAKLLKWIITIADIAAILLIRRHFIGTIRPAGTGGSDVVNDFDLARTLSSIKEEVYYLLGINKGPAYLSGIEWESVDAITKILVYLAIAAMMYMVIRFVIALIGGKLRKDRLWVCIKNAVFLLGFIIGSIAASCVTIRVEMRWMYTPFVFLLLLLSYMYGCIKLSRAGKCAFTSSVFIIFLVLTILTNLRYRQSWENIYFFPEQKSYNSLAQETWEKYGEEIFNKDIYIVGNPYNVTDFYKDTFFQVYDETLSGRSPTVTFVENISEVPDGENVIILMPDIANHTYVTVGSGPML